MSAAETRLQAVTVIEPTRGWRPLDLWCLWEFRELFWVLIMRDITIRYKQTVLGAAWAIIQPLTTMLIFSIFFGSLAQMPSQGYPYPIFVYSALLPWTFFANAVTASSSSVVGSSALVSKVYFPRLLIPLASAGACVLDLAISSLVLLCMMIVYHVHWKLNLLLVPFAALGLIVTAVGVGTFLAALTVAYRDFKYVIPFTMQLWMFLTPVIYPVTLIPERWRWVFSLNPVTGLVEAARWAFLGTPIDWITVAESLLVGGAMFLVGLAYFQRVERRFADIV